MNYAEPDKITGWVFRAGDDNAQDCMDSVIASLDGGFYTFTDHMPTESHENRFKVTVTVEKL